LFDKLVDNKYNLNDDISCTDFCQSISNDMFYFVFQLSSVLYDLEWKSGPYKPSLYK